jgi:hypothetical protein
MAPQEKKVKGIADIVFLLDATGSMSTCITKLKDNIGVFVDSLTGKDPNSKQFLKEFRAKVVGYRDFSDRDAPPFVDAPFVSTAAELRAQLAGLHAEGGGDEPESLLEALYRVAAMGETAKGAPLQADCWRPRDEALRAVIVFTDARFKVPPVEPAGATLKDVVLHLKGKKVLLQVFAPEFQDFDGYDDLTQLPRSEWHRIPIPADGNPQKALEDYTSNQENLRKVLAELGRTISKISEAEPVAI